jgi:hypothetical protein
VETRSAYATPMGNASLDGVAEAAEVMDAWRARLERWRRVRHLLDSAELGKGRLRQECLQAAGSILQLLAADEERWGDASSARVDELRRLITRGEVTPAAAAAREIMAAMELV